MAMALALVEDDGTYPVTSQALASASYSVLEVLTANIEINLIGQALENGKFSQKKPPNSSANPLNPFTTT